MSEQQPRRIVEELHDEPHVRGRRVTVRHIRDRVEGRGLDPKTVADRLDLDLADVYRALAYYHENPDEMRRVEAEYDRSFQRAQAKAREHRPDHVSPGPDHEKQ